MVDLTERATHFEFGENWSAYARSIDQAKITASVDGLRKLFPDGLAGKTFLDIGSGSGLSSLAALKLGSSRIFALDIDENSVTTTRELLSRFAPGLNWTCEKSSVFDLSPEKMGTFDIVYSWGVLHHTGDMWRSIENAASLVKPGGNLAIAIYNATQLDAMWKAEKRFYKNAPRPIQWLARQGYTLAVVAAKLLRGRNPIAFFRDYSNARGMNFTHDAHDWLGGYPYETSGPEEMRDKLSSLGFREARSYLWPASIGVFGSCCNEFVFLKAAP